MTPGGSPLFAASHINCEDDLWRRYQMDGTKSDENFLTHDPALCVEPPGATAPAGAPPSEHIPDMGANQRGGTART
eukprot:1190025-Prorocentrum_minimum.AAC.1